MEATTYIRGRSIMNQFIIVDECQNLTPHEVKTIISRCGEGTKMVLTGDPFQIGEPHSYAPQEVLNCLLWFLSDNPYLDANSNGLAYCVERQRTQQTGGNCCQVVVECGAFRTNTLIHSRKTHAPRSHQIAHWQKGRTGSLFVGWLFLPTFWCYWGTTLLTTVFCTVCVFFLPTTLCHSLGFNRLEELSQVSTQVHARSFGRESVFCLPAIAASDRSCWYWLRCVTQLGQKNDSSWTPLSASGCKKSAECKTNAKETCLVFPRIPASVERATV